jgi:SAM-dependent methyltransferase
VCVIGCGTGRDLLPFVAAGHDVVGIEPAAGPVATATRLLRERRSSAPVIHGFIEDVALPGAFDAIIFSPHCYSYIPGSARRVRLLERAAAHLNPGGRIALNFLRRTGSWSRLGVGIAGTMARLTGSDCPWEPHDVVQWAEGPRGRGLMFEHYFLPDEVHGEAARAGLRVMAHELDPFLGALSVVGR